MSAQKKSEAEETKRAALGPQSLARVGRERLENYSTEWEVTDPAPNPSP